MIGIFLFVCFFLSFHKKLENENGLRLELALSVEWWFCSVRPDFSISVYSCCNGSVIPLMFPFALNHCWQCYRRMSRNALWHYWTFASVWWFYQACNTRDYQRRDHDRQYILMILIALPHPTRWYQSLMNILYVYIDGVFTNNTKKHLSFQLKLLCQLLPHRKTSSSTGWLLLLSMKLFKHRNLPLCTVAVKTSHCHFQC